VATLASTGLGNQGGGLVGLPGQSVYPSIHCAVDFAQYVPGSQFILSKFIDYQ
jgi:hypothetical protein